MAKRQQAITLTKMTHRVNPFVEKYRQRSFCRVAATL